MRPAEIKEDLSLMTQRGRVSLILNSESFRKELEEIIETYTRSQESTGLNSSLLSLQHLPDLFAQIPGKRPLTGGGITKGIFRSLVVFSLQKCQCFITCYRSPKWNYSNKWLAWTRCKFVLTQRTSLSLQIGFCLPPHWSLRMEL